LASPTEETMTSSLDPALAKGGRTAVTITAAMLLDLRSLSRMARPCRASMLERVSFVKPFLMLSPVFMRPTTRP